MEREKFSYNIEDKQFWYLIDIVKKLCVANVG